MTAAGGELLGAVFNFLGELVGQDASTPAPPEEVVNNLCDSLSKCVEEDGEGRQRLSITLPNGDTLNNLAKTPAHLMGAK